MPLLKVGGSCKKGYLGNVRQLECWLGHLLITPKLFSTHYFYGSIFPLLMIAQPNSPARAILTPVLRSLIRFKDLLSDSHGSGGHLHELIFFDKLNGLLQTKKLGRNEL